jgi:hypothetical protein
VEEFGVLVGEGVVRVHEVKWIRFGARCDLILAM